MGISDFDETRSPEEVKALEELQALHDRGYTDPVKICGGDKVHPPYPHWKLALRMHTPCGQAVFDPDQHDRYCPARVILTPEQQALRKGTQFWSDAAASYGDN